MQNWTKKHPTIPSYYYQYFDAPKNIKEALLKQKCHEHAVEDIDLQLQLIETELDIHENDDVPYNREQFEKLNEKKIKLINAKRHHSNGAKAYWYFAEQGYRKIVRDLYG